MLKKTVSLLLVLTLALGLTVPAVAAGPSYDDVPETYWGYKDIEAAAEAGYMTGVGERQFAPEMKVSVAQFLTLLGRLVFPEVKIEDGDTWYGPYVAKAQETGLLDGSQVNTADVFGEISRYDMAVVLRAAAKKLGITEKQAQASEITDFGTIPNMYTEAVLTVYGMGLIKGDNAGRFNGSNTMRRAEIATVIMRLARATGSGTTIPTTPTPEPTESVAPTIPPDEELVTYEVWGYVTKVDHVIGQPANDKDTWLHGTKLKLYYTGDGGKTSTLVAEATAGPDSIAKYEMTFEAPESWGSSANHEAGNGFYFSAETVLDGQRLVTSDLRTDGRAYKDILRIVPGKEGRYNYRAVELTVPDGEKAKFTFKGYFEGTSFADDSPNRRLPNFTIQLHLEDGRLVGEAISGADGTFVMECEVDALDGGFSKEDALYYITFSGHYNGVRYAWDSTTNSGKRLLETIVGLDVLESNGMVNRNQNYRILVFDQWAQND